MHPRPFHKTLVCCLVSVCWLALSQSALASMAGEDRGDAGAGTSAPASTSVTNAQLMEFMRTQFDAMGSQMTTLAASVDAMAKRLGSVESKLSNLSADVGLLNYNALPDYLKAMIPLHLQGLTPTAFATKALAENFSFDIQDRLYIPALVAHFGEALQKGVRVFLPDTTTDEDLRYFKDATTVDLNFCTQITDAGLAYLEKATFVNLNWRTQITDAGLKYLQNATTVCLSGCTQITDAGLVHLTNAKDVYLSECTGITDAGLQHLKNATTVYLIGCTGVTDAGLAHLTNATTVHLSFCKKITDAAKAALRAKGVKVID